MTSVTLTFDIKINRGHLQVKANTVKLHDSWKGVFNILIRSQMFTNGPTDQRTDIYKTIYPPFSKVGA